MDEGIGRPASSQTCTPRIKNTTKHILLKNIINQIRFTDQKPNF